MKINKNMSVGLGVLFVIGWLVAFTSGFGQQWLWLVLAGITVLGIGIVGMTGIQFLSHATGIKLSGVTKPKRWVLYLSWVLTAGWLAVGCLGVLFTLQPDDARTYSRTAWEVTRDLLVGISEWFLLPIAWLYYSTRPTFKSKFES